MRAGADKAHAVRSSLWRAPIHILSGLLLASLWGRWLMRRLKKGASVETVRARS